MARKKSIETKTTKTTQVAARKSQKISPPNDSSDKSSNQISDSRGYLSASDSSWSGRSITLPNVTGFLDSSTDYSCANPPSLPPEADRWNFEGVKINTQSKSFQAIDEKAARLMMEAVASCSFMVKPRHVKKPKPTVSAAAASSSIFAQPSTRDSGLATFTDTRTPFIASTPFADRGGMPRIAMSVLNESNIADEPAPNTNSLAKILECDVANTDVDTDPASQVCRPRSVFRPEGKSLQMNWSMRHANDQPIELNDSDDLDESKKTTAATNNNNNDRDAKRREMAAENSIEITDDLPVFDRFNITENQSIPSNVAQKSALVLKGGKWKRALCDMRNKSMQTFTLSKSSRPPANCTTQTRLSVTHRKSISIQEVMANKKRSLGNESLNVLGESRALSDISTLVNPQQDGTFTQSNLVSEETFHKEFVSPVVDPSINLTSIEHNQRVHLLRKCCQPNAVPFDEVYSKDTLTDCRKIGEGVFGEIFLNQKSSLSYVLKVIPIEGAMTINGAEQKRIEEILQEVIISQELSALRTQNANQSAGFVEVMNTRLVKGRYPAHLMALWNAYDADRGSENESPKCFGKDQLYIVFELANSGCDLEKHKFKNAEQSRSVFNQGAISLAVAESTFQFEHRDLHWGNILIEPTTTESLTFLLNGKSIVIPSHGVKATIIDYSLSRILYKNCCFYQDLSADPELFEAVGDYQYEIYRLMKSHTMAKWEQFEPFTNVLWLHYVIDKMILGVKYSNNKSSKRHVGIVGGMKEVKRDLLNYKSAVDYVGNCH